MLKRAHTLKQQIQQHEEQLLNSINELPPHSPLISSSQSIAEIAFQQTLRQQWKKKQQLLQIETTLTTRSKDIENMEALALELSHALKSYQKKLKHDAAMDIQQLVTLKQVEIKLLLTLKSNHIDTDT
ncbi:hypothetical protein [Photobacterium lucens]|uniref:hypothetical protein n=1 Tax=Photobacterium lucens TaxID=2562949 RepID=UPI00136FEC3E|nr:hypothetical protein [Photobacterium lucens]MBP2701836.1 hypothetical protein [Vibrio parahaemolyticus]MZG82150.1 hypothetical protein [Photobacterium lucens]